MKKKMTKRQLVQLYIYHAIENWEWSYSSLVDSIVDDYDYNEEAYLLNEVLTEKEFFELTEKEFENYIPIDAIATDEQNDIIKNDLRKQLVKGEILNKQK